MSNVINRNMKFNVDLSPIHDLISKIDGEIIRLVDNTRNRVFSDIDISCIPCDIPQWILDAGHAQECGMAKNAFEKLVKENNNYVTNKYLYFQDCDALLFALQNRFTVVGTLIEEVYKQLSRHADIEDNTFNAAIISDDTSIHTHVCLNSLIINLASSCDLMTKVAFELEAIPNLDFTKYPKKASANITYGKSTNLKDALKQPDTYFAQPRPVPINKVETLRDELIHNGSLDYFYNVYSVMLEEEFVDFVLCPDMDSDGQFVSYNGRKKFYSKDCKTFNEVLPLMVSDVLFLALNTLQLLNSYYSTPYYSNEADNGKYDDVAGQWLKSELKVVKEISEGEKTSGIRPSGLN